MENHSYLPVTDDERGDELKRQYVIGWREWVSFPELSLEKIKAKIDTGARTSALHAFKVNLFEEKGVQMVSFSIHPVQHTQEKVIECQSLLHDLRVVTDSGGHKERRPVIKTPILLGHLTWQIEITLTNRDDMKFRFLLARSGIPENFLVSPSSSYLFKKIF